MPTAKKLPSGNWRCQVYSHSVIVTDEKGRIVYDKDGKPKLKRIRKSFTSKDKSRRGKLEAERMANDYLLHRTVTKPTADMTLLQAVEMYIDQKSYTLSESTIKDYDITKRHAFQDIMHLKLSELDEDILQGAVNRESMRMVSYRKANPKRISVKRLKNEYGLIRSVIKRYRRDFDFEMISLPKSPPRYHELLSPDVIFQAVKGTDMELAVLLAMWLSFTMSEIRGLTKSKSIDGNYITIKEVVIVGKDGDVRKDIAKNYYRNRRHEMPEYIRNLIDQVDGDVIVPLTSAQIYNKWTKILKDNGLQHMSFHDLRHVNASVMAMLRIPDKYAQERGGWKSDNIMKSVYQQTFSEERKKVDAVINDYFETFV